MKRIITIGREFGSGGRELGHKLAELLGYAYYDNEIITEIAKRTALSEEYVRQIAERKPSAGYPIHVGTSFYHMPDPAFTQSIAVYAEQHKLLLELSEKSDCVIVGRCADFVLRDKKPFRIFVYADIQSKIDRCVKRSTAGESLSEKDLKRKIADIDRGRAEYYAYFSDGKWGARESYDMLVNTSGKNIDDVARATYEYLKAIEK